MGDSGRMRWNQQEPFVRTGSSPVPTPLRYISTLPRRCLSQSNRPLVDLSVCSFPIPPFSFGNPWTRRSYPLRSSSFSLFLVPLLSCGGEQQSHTGSTPELANLGEIILEEEEKNKRVVRALYEALNLWDVETVHRLLAPDIEWWFHGPPSCQHMMRLLTGASRDDSFVFDPIFINEFGSTVLVEGQGWGGSSGRPVPWIHAWTVADGIITQVREYFNTSLTVTRLGSPEAAASPSSPSSSSSKSRASSSASQSHCVPLWQSRLSGGDGKKSVPGLLLAI